jgi:hypothetical protein
LISFSTDEACADNREVISGAFAPRKIEYVNYRDIPEETFKKIAFGKTVKVKAVGSSDEHHGFFYGQVQKAFQNLMTPEPSKH